MRPTIFVAIAALVTLAACSTFDPQLPDTPGSPDNAPAHGYFPIDPISVDVEPLPAAGPELTTAELLAAMPNETVRIAVGKIDASAQVTFGPIAAGTAGNSYVVIVDYVKFQTSSLPVDVDEQDRSVTILEAGSRSVENIVPVYLGVGLRLRADLHVLKGNVNLSNLAALGVAAEANRLRGNLVVQTLGISGPSTTTLLPLPSDINPSTIQNALVALGAMKAKLYDPGTLITPQAVGVYNNLGTAGAINSFVSSLLADPTSIKVKRLPKSGS